MLLVGEYITRMVPMGTHEWNRYLNLEDIQNMIHSQGFNTIAKTGTMISNPITMEMEEFPNWFRGNYMLMAKKNV